MNLRYGCKPVVSLSSRSQLQDQQCFLNGLFCFGTKKTLIRPSSLIENGKIHSVKKADCISSMSPTSVDNVCSRKKKLFTLNSTRLFTNATYLLKSSQTEGSTYLPQDNFDWPHKNRPRICILGGGFGGLYTALRLESLIWPAGTKPQVVLVDQSDRFVFKPLLYELLTNEVDEWEVAPRFTDLLAGTDVVFLKDTVKSVTPGGESTVELNSGLLLSSDWLVLSLGAESRLDLVPGAKEFAQPFSTLQDAISTGKKIQALERRSAQSSMSIIRVSVVGGGYSGVELASTIAQRLGSRGQVQIIDPSQEICATAPKGNREAAKKVLTARGVELLLGVKVLNISQPSGQDSAQTAAVLQLARDGSEPTFQDTDLVLWTVGTKPTVPSGAAVENGAFPVTGKGQADTESTLRVKGLMNVFALGDSAAAKDASGNSLSPTAQVAIQQSDYVAWNLWASINNRPLLPFRYTHLGEMLTLGTSDAAITPGFIEGITLEGPIAHAARKLAYLYRQPTAEHMAKVGVSWFAKSAVDTVAYFQDSFVKLLSSRA